MLSLLKQCWPLHRMWFWSALISQLSISGETVFIILITDSWFHCILLVLLIHSVKYMGYWKYTSCSTVCSTFFLVHSWMMLSILFLYSICIIAEISSKYKRDIETPTTLFFIFFLTFLEQMKLTEIPWSKLVLSNLNSRLCSTRKSSYLFANPMWWRVFVSTALTKQWHKNLGTASASLLLYAFG